MATPPSATATTSKKKKSAAQLRRLAKRARERGEEYPGSGGEVATAEKEEKEATAKQNDSSPSSAALIQVAASLQEQMALIQADGSLNSKDRRSAKRKAEAIATEKSGMTSSAELWKWIQEHASAVEAAATAKTEGSTTKDRGDANLSESGKVDLGRIAVRLKLDLEAVQANESLKSKERRAAKRKAEAVAAERAKLESAEKLFKWLKDHSEEAATMEKLLTAENKDREVESGSNAANSKGVAKDDADDNDNNLSKQASTPFVVFVGQLSYQTTSEGLRQHIAKFLTLEGEDDTSTASMSVRLLTHADSGKSRGMAFVQFSHAQHCQDCMERVHHTVLDGRRLNVERTSGGGGRERRRQRLQQSRAQQSLQMAETVQQLFDHYRKIATDEWDENVRAFCQRHSVAVVRQALEEYCQTKREKQKDGLEDVSPEKPSAYLTHMVNRIANSSFQKVGPGDTSATKKQRVESAASAQEVESTALPTAIDS